MAYSVPVMVLCMSSFSVVVYACLPYRFLFHLVLCVGKGWGKKQH